MTRSKFLFSFLRRFAIACVVVVVLTVAGVLAGDAVGRQKFAEARKVTLPDLRRATPGKPANYLLIGSDSRAFVDTPGEAEAFGTTKDTGNGHSDVMMVLHVNPAAHTGMLVSFPRDLVVKIPGHGTSLLTNAFAFGGANLVVQTIQNDFQPLTINHYIQVDFKGFQDIVNAIGKLKLYFPTPVNDQYTGLHINQTGCVSVDGAGALAYARSRHYNIPKNLQNPAPWTPRKDSQGNWYSPGWNEDPRADLDRIPRQQYFLRTIAQAAFDKTSNDVFKLNGLLDAVVKNLTLDRTLKESELKDLIRTFNGLDPARVDMETLPNEPASRPFLGHVQSTDAAQAVIARLADTGISLGPVPKPLPPHQVKVRIVNGSGIPKAAEVATAQFKAAGFDVIGEPQDADRSDYSRTQIRYAPGDYQQGITVSEAVETLNLFEAISRQNTLNADVLVVIGRDYNNLPHTFPGQPVATTTTTQPGASTSSTSATSTTTTTVQQVDRNYVPVDPKSGGPLVGCPH